MNSSNHAWKDWFRGHLLFCCYHCGTSSSSSVNWFGFYNVFICKDCQSMKPKYGLVSASEAMKFYYLKESDLNQLRYITKTSNHLNPSKMYLFSDVKQFEEAMKHKQETGNKVGEGMGKHEADTEEANRTADHHHKVSLCPI